MNKVTITIKYAGDTLSKSFDTPVTVGQILANKGVKGALGFDQVDAFINGVKVESSTFLNNGDALRLENRACTKA